MDDRHGTVSQRAYAIWQEQGQPEGRDADHWQQAEREIADTAPATEPVEGAPDEGAPFEAAAAPAPTKAKKKPARAPKPA